MPELALGLYKHITRQLSSFKNRFLIRGHPRNAFRFRVLYILVRSKRRDVRDELAYGVIERPRIINRGSQADGCSTRFLLLPAKKIRRTQQVQFGRAPSLIHVSARLLRNAGQAGRRKADKKHVAHRCPVMSIVLSKNGRRAPMPS
jgi:hypothetical protein